MDAAFAWLGQLADWLGNLFPRWRIVRSTHGGVKFVRGKRIVQVAPGIVWYWPAVTEIVIIPTARTTVNLQSQTITTVDDKAILVSAMLVLEVRDTVKLLGATHDVDEMIADIALAEIYSVLCGLSWSDIRERQQNGDLDRKLRTETRRGLEKYGVWVAEAMMTDLAPCRVYRLVQTNS
jgi:regulator of protease activity HflC (stomatin/prohibitin superfamily)